MARRVKIAVIYYYDENWIGGTYYIQNLICACNFLPDKDKPKFLVIASSEKDFEDLKKVTQYPYLYSPDHFLKEFYIRVRNRISTILFKKTFIIERYRSADIVFPAGHERKLFNKQQYLNWIPDFQEHYLPEFFTKEEISKRKIFQSDMLKRAKYIVFSSKAAKKDFDEIYNNNSVRQFVMPFAVSHPVLTNDFPQLLNKFNIPAKYFICSNQFWKHKNHSVILKAINCLKLQGINVTVVFTGKEYDNRNPDYFNELKRFVETCEIEHHVKFLGFISRDEQLVLMKNAVAIIQPSLFEGWSTVIEDGKALNQKIVASAIDVHKEQLEMYLTKCFFNPNEGTELAAELLRLWHEEPVLLGSNPYDYKKDISRFAQSFIDIVSVIKNDK